MLSSTKWSAERRLIVKSYRCCTIVSIKIGHPQTDIMNAEILTNQWSFRLMSAFRLQLRKYFIQRRSTSWTDEKSCHKPREQIGRFFLLIEICNIIYEWKLKFYRPISLMHMCKWNWSVLFVLSCVICCSIIVFAKQTLHQPRTQRHWFKDQLRTEVLWAFLLKVIIPNSCFQLFHLDFLRN